MPGGWPAGFCPGSCPWRWWRLWQVAASQWGWLSSRVLPAPLDVVRAASALAASGELWTHVQVSAGRALTGLAIGGGLGLVLGLLTGSARWAETLLDTSIQMVRNIPALALIPLVILWFGIDEAAKLFLIAVSVFFPIYLNTFHGIRGVDPGLIEMGRTYGLNRWQLYRQIVLPGALSSILVGLRFSLGLMWVILIVAETISAQAGIGYLTMNAREFLQTDIVLVGILLYALLGKLADLVSPRAWNAGGCAGTLAMQPPGRCAASPFSLRAARFGKGDDASAAGRPLRGVPRLGPRPVPKPCFDNSYFHSC
jgi:sulfonate transport system permease protein